MWSPKGALSVQMPFESSFVVQGLRWNARGNALLVVSKDQMCVCYLGDEDGEDIRPSRDITAKLTVK